MLKRILAESLKMDRDAYTRAKGGGHGNAQQDR
jgi:hypothetical protein